MSHATLHHANDAEATSDDDRVIIHGSVNSGGHTWTAREDRAVKTLARAVVFTAIDLLRDSGWESEFEQAELAPHDWQAIDDEVDRILRSHLPVPANEIEAALAVLAPRAAG